jgi:hypothetical protein
VSQWSSGNATASKPQRWGETKRKRKRKRKRMRGRRRRRRRRRRSRRRARGRQPIIWAHAMLA